VVGRAGAGGVVPAVGSDVGVDDECDVTSDVSAPVPVTWADSIGLPTAAGLGEVELSGAGGALDDVEVDVESEVREAIRGELGD